MQRALVSLALALGATLAMVAAPLRAAGTWPMQGHDPMGTNADVDDSALTPATVVRLHQVWTSPHVLTAVATGTDVYAITSPGPLSSRKVVVLNARTGATVRSFDRYSLFRSKKDAAAPQALAYAGGRLVIGADGAMAALNPATGQVVWRLSLGANALTIAGGTIYTGALCQARCVAPSSYALDLQTGRVLWRHSENGGEQPMLIAGHLFQVWQPDTRVYDQRTGHLLATIPLQAQWMGDGNGSYAFVSAPPALASPATVKAWVARIGPTGKPIWKVALGTPADPNGDGQAALADHNVYVPSNRFHPGVIAVNTANGKVRWGADIGSRFNLVAVHHLLFAIHVMGGVINVLDARSGKTLRRLAIPARAGQPVGALVAGGTLYVKGSKELVALRP
ncbi:MAG: hypothetical protein NVSMB22_13970 [Chloroflexota bacterium]